MPDVVQRYVESGRVRLVWHDFAWIGEESRLAAQGARCAGESQFWAYHDLLFARQRGANTGTFARGNLPRFAGERGLDTAAFGACLERGADLAAIQQAVTSGRLAGVTATPTFVVGERRIGGAQGVTRIAAAIDAELARLGQ